MPDACVLVRQVLAQQGQRDVDLPKVGEQPGLGRADLRVGPVVAEAVAVAVSAGEALLVDAAGVVALPLTWLSEHPALDNVREVRLIRGGDELLLDSRQGEQRLTQCKGEPWAHFEDGPVAVSYTHLRAHETGRNLVCRLLLE